MSLRAQRAPAQRAAASGPAAASSPSPRRTPQRTHRIFVSSEKELKAVSGARRRHPARGGEERRGRAEEPAEKAQGRTRSPRARRGCRPRGAGAARSEGPLRYEVAVADAGASADVIKGIVRCQDELCCHHWQLYLATHPELTYGDWENMLCLGRVREFIEHGVGVLYAKTQMGDVVGYLSFSRLNSEADPTSGGQGAGAFLKVNHLVVLERHRRAGVGRLLMTEFLQKVGVRIDSGPAGPTTDPEADVGVQIIAAELNEGAISWYRSMGFRAMNLHTKECGERKICYLDLRRCWGSAKVSGGTDLVPSFCGHRRRLFGEELCGEFVQPPRPDGQQSARQPFRRVTAYDAERGLHRLDGPDGELADLSAQFASAGGLCLGRPLHVILMVPKPPPPAGPPRAAPAGQAFGWRPGGLRRARALARWPRATGSRRRRGRGSSRGAACDRAGGGHGPRASSGARLGARSRSRSRGTSPRGEAAASGSERSEDGGSSAAAAAGGPPEFHISLRVRRRRDAAAPGEAGERSQAELWRQMQQQSVELEEALGRRRRRCDEPPAAEAGRQEPRGAPRPPEEPRGAERGAAPEERPPRRGPPSSRLRRRRRACRGRARGAPCVDVLGSEDSDTSPDVWEDWPCRVCGRNSDDSAMILCDGKGGTCNATYHYYCIGEVRVPRGKWFCPPCVAAAALDSCDAAPAPQGSPSPPRAAAPAGVELQAVLPPVVPPTAAALQIASPLATSPLVVPPPALLLAAAPPPLPAAAVAKPEVAPAAPAPDRLASPTSSREGRACVAAARDRAGSLRGRARGASAQKEAQPPAPRPRARTAAQKALAVGSASPVCPLRRSRPLALVGVWRGPASRAHAGVRLQFVDDDPVDPVWPGPSSAAATGSSATAPAAADSAAALGEPEARMRLLPLTTAPEEVAVDDDSLVSVSSAASGGAQRLESVSSERLGAEPAAGALGGRAEAESWRCRSCGAVAERWRGLCTRCGASRSLAAAEDCQAVRSTARGEGASAVGAPRVGAAPRRLVVEVKRLKIRCGHSARGSDPRADVQGADFLCGEGLEGA